MTPSSPATLTVTELTRIIKRRIESSYDLVSVQGEVLNLRAQTSGHYYFTLKDEHARISIALFKGVARGIARLPETGDKVIVTGKLSLYMPRGTYQIIAREVRSTGLGELLIRLHRLKEELRKKGFFSPEAKRSLPSNPTTIGVVTSPTGAVIQDILQVLERRYPSFHLLLNPVKVQGPGAAEEIARAIDDFNRFALADVLIVGRGGGSMEDLWPFNERSVAEALFRSTIPVISAVGHETDTTIADLVADTRAPTPSAAAEMATKEQATQLEFLRKARRHISFRLEETVRRSRIKLANIYNHPLICTPDMLPAGFSQKLDETGTMIDRVMEKGLAEKRLAFSEKKHQLERVNPQSRLRSYREKTAYHEKTLLRLSETYIARKREHLTLLERHLTSIRPEQLLRKGYCIPFAEKDASVIMTASSVRRGDAIRLRFRDGTVRTKAYEVDSVP
ncbi:MAG: exodeoxyribonuclease VII large subunit [Simkaniaceae bacterium]|nr:exodeoxyribonuclease VII large subunit [Simkaniaceae bacterium]